MFPSMTSWVTRRRDPGSRPATDRLAWSRPISLHRYFTELQVALEPVSDATNTYNVLTFGKVAPRLGLPKTVKLFTSSAATDAPLPNPAYLALHAAVCRLVWASARAEELTDVLADLEDVTLLAEDGSSANLINIAIYRSLAAAEA